MEPIRNPLLLGKDIEVMVPVFVRMLADLIGEYRPGELGVFQERVRAWRPYYEVAAAT